MNNTGSQERKFPFIRITLASLLMGVIIGSPLGWNVIENNEGGEFWHHEGNPEIGPIMYDYYMVFVGFLVWIGPLVILSFLVLSALTCLANVFKPQ
jgi:hypothetical protein